MSFLILFFSTFVSVCVGWGAFAFAFGLSPVVSVSTLVLIGMAASGISTINATCAIALIEFTRLLTKGT